MRVEAERRACEHYECDGKKFPHVLPRDDVESNANCSVGVAVPPSQSLLHLPVASDPEHESLKIARMSWRTPALSS